LTDKTERKVQNLQEARRWKGPGRTARTEMETTQVHEPEPAPTHAFRDRKSIPVQTRSGQVARSMDPVKTRNLQEALQKTSTWSPRKQVEMNKFMGNNNF